MLTKTAQAQTHPEALEQDNSDFEVVVRPRNRSTAAAPVIPANRLADGIGTVLVVAAIATALGWAIGDRTGQAGAKARIEASERSAQLAKQQAETLTNQKAQFCQGGPKP